ncbi:MAG: fumarylacetoacetase [Candidatus Promineifilaceae bacterium]|nr:fumarylacetoacetase [Candidatus Promineifilaceae bacterium]
MESFVEVPAESHFSWQNLPYGVFSRPDHLEPRVGVAIGHQILDLTVLEEKGFIDEPELLGRRVFSKPTLNAFLALGRPAWSAARTTIQTLLRADNPRIRDDAELLDWALVDQRVVQMHLPVAIGDYTDFYSSREHATNVGTMFRGRENALQPNWLHLPVAYHGRASSVVVSGTVVRRPWGQLPPDQGQGPPFAPSRELDFELEMGFFVGRGNELGQPIPVAEAEAHIFGLVLVNDWSARDIQRWEYRPLGPFLSKNLATSISPWVVTLDALAPFRCAGPQQDPQPLPYLQTATDWALDIQLEARLQTDQMAAPTTVSRTNARKLYWNMAQQLAHHTISGCNMRPGDLLASGTISGDGPDSYGSLLELSWRGQRPLTFPNGETRTFLADGDRVILTGWAQGEGYRVGFGEVTGQIGPAMS